MPIVQPARYTGRVTKRRRKPVFVPIIVGLLVLVGCINYARALPVPTATLNVSVPAAARDALAWPAGGQAAVAADGYGLLDSYGQQKPLATASIAKVITALCVLEKAPLNVGQSGSSYTVSANDVAIYNNYVAQNGSVVQVQQGERITEYQAIEALMVPSANNIADSLVGWVFGGHQAYASYAATYLQEHGMDNTQIGADASGFDAGTISTANDLTTLGLLALKNPVLMQIAGKHTVTLPVAGTVSNYNTILGQNGITGLKTGNNDADPGAFLFTSTLTLGDKNIKLTGAVMGADDLPTALYNSSRLSESMQQNFELATIVQKDQQVGELRAAWGNKVPITAADTLQLIRWKATPITETHQLQTSVRSGTVGVLKVAAGKAQSQVSLQLSEPLAGPSFWWRLTRH